MDNIDNTKNVEINTGDIDMNEKPSTSGVKNPKYLNPTYYNVSYEKYDREKILWDKRFNKWTPKPTTEQNNFLDLDCVAYINKTIQLWVDIYQNN